MANEALLIIDVQNAILGPGNTKRRVENLRALDEVVARIARLIAGARSHHIPVLFVQHDGQPGHRLERGSPGWHIKAEITPAVNEPVIHKTACDSFFNTTLTAELKLRNVDRLIVTGCMTQYCVDTTVRRAVSLGYDVTLIRDGHMTADTDALTFEQIIAHHNALLDGFDAGRHSVRVVPHDQISV
ncbi:MAG: cysteine hydrolase family protein [Candidatus Korobacteraceae bacterium]|jgi:nicotinamidase-related amidase